MSDPRRVILTVLLAAFSTALALAQSPIVLTVDASQAPLKLIHTQMVMPVQPGPLTMEYPKWIPGEHEPDGPIGNVVSLRFTGNGQAIPWMRDPLDMFTFHVTVPQGVSQLTIAFDYIEGSAGEYTSGGSATDKLVDINWNQNLLYPAGTPAAQILIEPHLMLPPQWQFGTALPLARQSGGQLTFQTVGLNRLVDSPVIAGQYYQAFDITPPGEPIHHELDIVADSPQAINVTPELQQDMTNLVAESGKLFGARHYRDYHFLLTLSDHVAHFGLEHHESDDSRLPERALMGPDPGEIVGELLPHEFMHSWNGKFRRPADLASPPYEAPMQDDLLWVYEGLTDFLGNIEATRSGLWTDGQYHQFLADTAAELGPGRPGRTWRPLQDTATAEAGMFENGDPAWINWRRDTDYYEEGDLLWLEVATLLNRASNGQKTIDDFCHLFHGGPNDGPQVKTYTFDQVADALNSVAQYDWAGFLKERLNSLSPQSPVGGIENGGWKVVYTAEPERLPGRRGTFGDTYSLGLELAPDGTVNESIVDSPAFKVGISSGMKIAGINGHIYTQDVLEDAVKSEQPISFLVIADDYYKTVTVDYRDGPKFPHLVREEGKPDLLDDLIKPRAETK
jgi:predicted metalloprotease with PDZ domain